MEQGCGEVRRRDILKGIAAAGVSGALAATGASAAGQAPSAVAIPVRTLGKTGLKLPVLGFGGAALPAAWGNPLSRDGRVELVQYAVARGIRYFDTAPASYMESQSILGQALKGRRAGVCLVTKVDTTQATEVAPSVEQSLKELQTDYLDVVLIHGTPGLEQMSVEQAMKVRAEIAKLRDRKVVRFIGFSAHGYFDKALALIESGGFDLCMLSYGYIPRGYDQIWSARMTELRSACVAAAHERGMGIVAMKVVGAGMLGAWSQYLAPAYDKQRLAGLPGAAIRWALQDPRIHILNIGMRLKPEIDANIGILTAGAAFSLDDRALLTDFCAKLYETDAIKKMRIE
jgi:predicted aldo/keto reductase-like oxidoreductase